MEEKIEDKKNEEKAEDVPKAELNKEYEKQLRWVVLGAVFLFLVIGAFYFIYISMTSFDYNGTEFNKIKIGDLIFYRVSFPLSSATGQHIADYNLFLRNDPRKLDYIPVEGEVNLKQRIIVTSDENLICNDNSIALANLVQYFEGVPKIPVNAVSNITCAKLNSTTTTLISIQNSTVSKITRVSDQCYTIEMNNCDVLNTTERFILETVSSYQ